MSWQEAEAEVGLREVKSEVNPGFHIEEEAKTRKLRPSDSSSGKTFLHSLLTSIHALQMKGR